MASGRNYQPAALHPLAIAVACVGVFTNGIGMRNMVREDIFGAAAEKARDDFAHWLGKFKGAIVIFAEPALLPPSELQPRAQPLALSLYGDLMQCWWHRTARARKSRQVLIREFPFKPQRRPGRSARWQRSRMTASLMGCFNMTGRGGRKYDIAPILAAFVSVKQATR